MMLQTRMIYFDDLVGKFQESKDGSDKACSSL